jgi:hypothetical protein
LTGAYQICSNSTPADPLPALNKPIPEDLVPILAKNEEKRRAIKEKTSKDAAPFQARAIGASNPTTASWGLPVADAKNCDSNHKPITQALALGSKITSNNAQALITAANMQKMASAAAASASATATITLPGQFKGLTVGERLQPSTLDTAITEKDKYAAKTKWTTGYALTLPSQPIGLQRQPLPSVRHYNTSF